MNWPLLQNSLLLAGTTTALAVGFGLSTALWLATLEARWRNVFLALAVVALALPPFLVTNCWISLLGDNGALRAWLPFRIYSLSGTIWILSLMLWPITLFAALGAWRRLEAAQFESEPAMRGFALLRWLLLPVARGELALAAVVTFVLALNNFAVPAILQTKVLPDELWVQFNTTFFQTQDGRFDFPALARLTWPLVIAPVILLLWTSPRASAWPRIQGSVPARIFRRQLGLSWFVVCGGIALALCAVSAALPLAQIALVGRTWTELPGALAAGQGATWSSFWLATLAATAVISLGFATLANPSQRRDAESAAGRREYAFLRVFSAPSASLRLIVPWMLFFLPGVLLGIALIHLFNRPLLVSFYQSAGIVILAFVIRYFAFGGTAARHALRSMDSDLTDAARLEGASRWQMLRFVQWAQISPQVLAAWYVVYLLCLWDVESMILVVPPGGETLALRIFNLLHYGHNAQVNGLCVALLGLAVGPLMLWGIISALRRMGSGLRVAWMPACVVLLFNGCSPSDGSRASGLDSRFFGRAEVIGSRGVGLGEFNKPRSVAVDAQNNVYAVDMTGRVQKFSPAGQFLLSWQMPQTDKGKPKGMGRDRDGNILVIEPHYQRVNHFTPEGKLVAQWGCRGTNPGCFILPRGIAENSQREFFVSEYMGAERVQKFALKVPRPESGVRSQPVGGTSPLAPALSPSDSPPRSALAERGGEREDRPPSPAKTVAPRLLGVIGKAGTGPGEFNRAEGICVDSHDRIYVADSCNHRIQIFSSDGKFIREYGKAGTGKGELSYPYDIVVDARGYQFVCEFGNSRIQIFDAHCQPVEIIGGQGAAPGRFANPWGVALDSHGNLYVADALNHRVQKLMRRMGQMGLITNNHASRFTHNVSR